MFTIVRIQKGPGVRKQIKKLVYSVCAKFTYSRPGWSHLVALLNEKTAISFLSVKKKKFSDLFFQASKQQNERRDEKGKSKKIVKKKLSFLRAPNMPVQCIVRIAKRPLLLLSHAKSSTFPPSQKLKELGETNLVDCCCDRQAEEASKMATTES